MLWNWAPSSSAQRTTSTLFQRAAASAWGEAAGAVTSVCRHPQGSLCSSVSRSRIRESGWKPSERSLLNPWPRRIMLVRCCCYTWCAAVWSWTHCSAVFNVFLLCCRWSQLEEGEMTISAYWVCSGLEWLDFFCWFCLTSQSIISLRRHAFGKLQLIKILNI